MTVLPDNRKPFYRPSFHIKIKTDRYKHIHSNDFSNILTICMDLWEKRYPRITQKPALSLFLMLLHLKHEAQRFWN